MLANPGLSTMAKKPKYYVVWKGRKPGIYRSWEECTAQVNHYPGAQFKSFETLREAREAAASDEPPSFRKPKAVSKAFSQEMGTAKPVKPSWCVDAACSGNPGQMEYRCVDTETGIDIFRQGPFEDGTNNIGEFLALVHALALASKNELPDLPIYSDSKIAMTWVRGGKAKTTLERTRKNRQIFDLIERAEKWIQCNIVTNPVLKWETKQWGEIPADFGRK